MKKVLLVCMLALAAAFSITGCSSASASKDCCQSESSSEKPDCCKDEETENSVSGTIADVPDCCAGE